MEKKTSKAKIWTGGAILLLIAVVLFAGTWKFTTRQVIDLISHQSHHQEGMYGAFLENQLHNLDKIADMMVAVHELPDALENPNDEELVEKAEHFLEDVRPAIGVLSIGLITAKGEFLVGCHEDAEHDVFGPNPTAHDEVYMAFRDGKGRVPRIGSRPDEPSLFIARAIDKGSDRLGVVVLEFPIEILKPGFWKGDPNNHYLVADEFGIIFFSTKAQAEYKSLTHIPEGAKDHVDLEDRYPVEEIDPLPIATDNTRGGIRVIALNYEDDTESQAATEKRGGHDADSGGDHHGAAKEDDHHGSAKKDDHGDDHGGGGDHHGGGKVEVVDGQVRYIVSQNDLEGTGGWSYLVLSVDKSSSGEYASYYRKNMLIAGLAYMVILLAVFSYVQHRGFIRKLTERAIRDPLTKLFTRRYMDEAVQAMMRYDDRHENAKLATILFDIDHFKKVNDTYGHPKGDEVLVRVASELMKGSRAEDVQVRLGGEELALFARVEKTGEAIVIAERVRRSIEKLSFEHEGKEFNVTISGGVSLRKPSETMEKMMARADEELYKAKTGGRNQICLSEPEES